MLHSYSSKQGERVDKAENIGKKEIGERFWDVNVWIWESYSLIGRRSDKCCRSEWARNKERGYRLRVFVVVALGRSGVRGDSDRGMKWFFGTSDPWIIFWYIIATGYPKKRDFFVVVKVMWYISWVRWITGYILKRSPMDWRKEKESVRMRQWWNAHGLQSDEISTV